MGKKRARFIAGETDTDLDGGDGNKKKGKKSAKGKNGKKKK